VVVEDRVDALVPLAALFGQRVPQPYRLAQLEDVGRSDPRLRQPLLLEQLTQMPSIRLVGLGAPLLATSGSSIGRLGQVRLEPGPLELVDHEPPTGGGLDRERTLTDWELFEPCPQHLPGCRRDPPASALAAVVVDPVEVICARCTSNPPTTAIWDLLDRCPWTQHVHRACGGEVLHMPSIRVKRRVRGLWRGRLG
jgi:hypothetical protein